MVGEEHAIHVPHFPFVPGKKNNHEGVTGSAVPYAGERKKSRREEVEQREEEEQKGGRRTGERK